MAQSARKHFHDINNTLGVVILNLEQVNSPAGSSTTRQDAAADALAEARKLATVLNELRRLVESVPAGAPARAQPPPAAESATVRETLTDAGAELKQAAGIDGAASATGPVIVVIDDDAAQRRAVFRLLDGAADQIVEARDGAAGLAQVRAHRPELVLLDVQMPGLDGYEVCRRLRADPRTAETVIIMMTALADPQSRQHGIVAGADDFLTKPIDGLELKTRVANIIRLSRYRRLMRERVKFEWLADQADAGYLMLAGPAAITYANQRARE